MKERMIAWMADSVVADFMNLQWSWPGAEIIHFIGMSLLFGSIMIIDVRLLGFFRRDVSLHAVHGLAPWALLGFLLNLVSGVGFVMRDMERYWPNPDFWFKLACILLAGVNSLVFLFVFRKELKALPDDADVGTAAKAVGVSSLVLWTLVIWAGRMLPVYGDG